ncbi:hypothetical protein JOB18_033457 [Solea senegalensis]|uniref:Uncharacterized protein n=1 Tax=Solea senegalensis TaxID=28829 RepID=A0AAV6STY3_SOLSE|nr:hypothetical protein JOB18_033457 [Solea senegalensis]
MPLSEHMNYAQGLILSRRNGSLSVSRAFKYAETQSFIDRVLTVSDIRALSV